MEREGDTEHVNLNTFLIHSQLICANPWFEIVATGLAPLPMTRTAPPGGQVSLFNSGYLSGASFLADTATDYFLQTSNRCLC